MMMATMKDQHIVMTNDVGGKPEEFVLPAAFNTRLLAVWKGGNNKQ